MTDLIEGHLDHCKAAGLSDLTVRDRGELLRRLDRDLPHGFEKANTVELRTWLSHPRPMNATTEWHAWAQETLCTYYTHLRSYYRWAVRNGHLSHDPTDLLDAPKRPKGLPHPISEPDLRIALDRGADRWQLPFRLGAFAGLRCCEIATIRSEQITPTRIWVFGKGRKTRTIKTHPLIWELARNLPPGPAVRGGRGRPMESNTLSRQASAHFTNIGLPAETMHRLRHRFATRLLLPRELGGAGASIRAVQVLMGHESLATTEVYLLVTDEETGLAVDGLLIPAAA